VRRLAWLPRRPWLAFVVSALIALIVLVVLSLRPLSVRQYALGAPDQFPVAVLKPGDRVCEGPIRTPTSIQQVGIWGGAVTDRSDTTVSVDNAGSGRELAGGTLTATGAAEQHVTLSRTIAADQSIRVCLTQRRNAFSLLGSPSVNPTVVMTGAQPGSQYSLVLLQRSGTSLLNSLPTAFSRASLFKPSWVGSWTFWLLAGLLVATIALGAIGIALAAREDEAPGAPDQRTEGS
jgi:hypothetical protein